MNFMKWIVTLAGCLLVFGALATWKVMDIRAAIAAGEAYPEQSESVEAAVVSTAQFTPTISVIGEILAPQRLDLRNEIAGEITAVNFTSGDQVKAGQLLIQLDTAVEQANLDAAKARAELARLVHERNLKLFESRVINEDLLNRTQADLTGTQSEISVLERTIAKKTLRSPFAGRAGLHNFEVGQYLAENTLITSLVGATADMWIDFQMPQFYPQLPVGTALNITTISNSSTAPQSTATVIAENTVLNANNRSRGYRASVPNDTQQYAPATVVQLSVPIGTSERLLQVPALAIQNDPLGQYVFVLREDAAKGGFRAVRQQVQVRLIEADRALVESGAGLTEGAHIAAAGAFKLYEGILVFTRERHASGGEEQADSRTSTVESR